MAINRTSCSCMSCMCHSIRKLETLTKVKVSQVQVRVGIGLGVLTKRKEQKRIIIRNVFKLIVPPKLSLLSSHETSLWKNRKQPISNCTEIVHHPG